jgi:hypothetical protein
MCGFCFQSFGHALLHLGEAENSTIFEDQSAGVAGSKSYTSVIAE